MRTMPGPRFRSLVALAAMATVLGSGVFSSVAGAVTASSATLTMTSDAGDYIGAGQQYSYSTSANDVFGSSTTGANSVHVSLSAANSDWWFLDFAAPSGQTLVPGTYTGATRYPFQGQGPGLSVDGNGRGCNMLTGSFTVTGITFGPNNYLQTFDASFEQHCEGSVPAFRGTLHIVNPPAPVPLTVRFGLSAWGAASRVSGIATVSGTVTCNQPASVSVSGTLTQRATRFAYATGSFTVQVACSKTPTAWRATVMSSNSVPFNHGNAQLDATASAFDAAYGQPVTVSHTAIVRLLTTR